MNRRQLLAAVVAGAASPALRAGDGLPEAVVWKTPTCGCCGAWVRHLEANGFRARVIERADLAPVKAEHRIPPRLESCHTALIGGYVVEGHVPAADILRLLRERPAGVRGLVVPGMPAGSPGMEGPVSERYATLALAEDGRTAVFAEHGPAKPR